MSFGIKRRNICFCQFYIFGINFGSDCGSGYSIYNQIVCSTLLKSALEQNYCLI